MKKNFLFLVVKKTLYVGGLLFLVAGHCALQAFFFRLPFYDNRPAIKAPLGEVRFYFTSEEEKNNFVKKHRSTGWINSRYIFKDEQCIFGREIPHTGIVPPQGQSAEHNVPAHIQKLENKNPENTVYLIGEFYALPSCELSSSAVPLLNDPELLINPRDSGFSSLSRESSFVSSSEDPTLCAVHQMNDPLASQDGHERLHSMTHHVEICYPLSAFSRFAIPALGESLSKAHPEIQLRVDEEKEEVVFNLTHFRDTLNLESRSSQLHFFFIEMSDFFAGVPVENLFANFYVFYKQQYNKREPDREKFIKCVAGLKSSVLIPHMTHIPNLLFTGGPGSGKTFLAVSALKFFTSCHDFPLKILFLRPQDLHSILAKGSSQSLFAPDQIIFFDGLGERDLSNSSLKNLLEKLLENLLDRHDQRLFITTNCHSADDFWHKLSQDASFLERIARIFHICAVPGHTSSDKTSIR